MSMFHMLPQFLQYKVYLMSMFNMLPQSLQYKVYLMSMFHMLPQSLQMAAFLFTVCHVVIVVQDWFADINMYRYFGLCTVALFHVFFGIMNLLA